jgi:hypothetical protein
LKKKERHDSGNVKLLKGELDVWVKDFERKIQRTEEMNLTLNETKSNTDFNYELILQMQKEIQLLRKDVDKLKHYAYVALVSRPLRNIE